MRCMMPTLLRFAHFFKELPVRLTLRHKILVYVFVPFIILSILLLAVDLYVVRRRVQQDVGLELSQRAQHYTQRIDAALQAVANVAYSTARFLESVDSPDMLSEAQLYRIVRSNVDSHRLVYGSAIAWAPGVFASRARFSPYAYEVYSPSGVGVAQLDIADAYDYTDAMYEWWHAPVTARRALWTEPYFDEGAGNILMSTFSAPFYQQQLWGVATIDIPLLTLRQALGLAELQKQEFFIVSSSGAYLFHPDSTYILAANVLEQAQDLKHPPLLQLANAMLAGEQGYLYLPALATPTSNSRDNIAWAEHTWVAYAPIPSSNWSFALTIPAEQALAPVRRQMRRSALGFAGMSVALLVFGIILASRLTGRIQRLEPTARQLANGTLSTIPVHGHDEISQLTHTLNLMAAQIHAREHSLRSENMRLADEVAVVQHIQRTLLPKRTEIDGLAKAFQLDIAVFMQAADEVGGDYYDILQGDDHLIIAVGDVAGHGLDSGVLMLMTQMGVRTLLEHKEHDGQAFLSSLNRALYKNIQRMRSSKDLSLLLLAYYPLGSAHTHTAARSPSDGVLSKGALPAGVVSDARVPRAKLQLSGQHECLLWIHADGALSVIDTLDTGFPLGLVADIEAFVSPLELELAAGEGLVLYSDGITEAPSPTGELYGLQRLCDVVCAHWQKSASHIKQHIIMDLYDHIAEAPIEDDVTLVVVKQA